MTLNYPGGTKPYNYCLTYPHLQVKIQQYIQALNTFVITILMNVAVT